MSKSALVMETPENCMECPLLTDSDECIMQNKEANRKAGSYTKLKEGCPLREMPEKKEVMGVPRIPSMSDFERRGFQKGWNACINTITGGTE